MFSIMKIALRNALVAFLFIGGAFTYLQYFGTTANVAAPSQEVVPGTFIIPNGCYTDKAPDPTVIPSKAIVTTKDGETRVESSHRALSQLFEGVNYGLTIHAFCV